MTNLFAQCFDRAKGNLIHDSFFLSLFVFSLREASSPCQTRIWIRFAWCEGRITLDAVEAIAAVSGFAVSRWCRSRRCRWPGWTQSGWLLVGCKFCIRFCWVMESNGSEEWSNFECIQEKAKSFSYCNDCKWTVQKSMMTLRSGDLNYSWNWQYYTKVKKDKFEKLYGS